MTTTTETFETSWHSISRLAYTQKSRIENCSGTICTGISALKYGIPTYVSLKRSYGKGDPNALYKVSGSTTEFKDSCGTVFDVLEAAAGEVLIVPDAFGATKLAACRQQTESLKLEVWKHFQVNNMLLM